MTLEELKGFANEDPDEEPEEEEEDEDEEDLVDPIIEVKEKCGESACCVPYKKELEVCEDRVNGRSRTSEECTQELFDFLHCRDNCMSKILFSKLK